MEKNTFATSAYIATSEQTAFDYLCSLKNLDEWTLFSRMKEQLDEDTWRGTASGYHKDLYKSDVLLNLKSLQISRTS